MRGSPGSFGRCRRGKGYVWGWVRAQPCMSPRKYIRNCYANAVVWACVRPRWGLDSVMEAAPLPEVGGSALYQPFKKGYI